MPLPPVPPTLTAAAADLASGALSPQALVDACLARIAALNPHLNAFIAVTPPVPHAPAPAGPLANLPIALKDLFDQEGVPTTAASAAFLDNTPEEDAQVVARLRNAGALFIGKTNLHEWALGVTNLSSHFGAVLNPWNRAHVPGGSSGGSAVAVLTGQALAATGSDTGGSIRIPAALCGITGLKPTYGRVSLRGVIPLSWSFDHAGPMTRTAEDAALMLSVMAGYDPDDPYSVDQHVPPYVERLQGNLRGLRIGVPREHFYDGLHPEVEAAVHAALAVFSDLGVEVAPLDLRGVSEIAQAAGSILLADAGAFHEERLLYAPELFVPVVYERMRAGLDIRGIAYARARRVQIAWQRRLEHAFNTTDLIATPTVGIPAPTLVEAADLKPFALTRFTNPFNVSGSPAISIPCGFTSAGLPIGLQLVARHWDEATLLRAAHVYQQTTTWHLRVPEVSDVH